MRQSDKRDYKIIAVMLLVALFSTVLALAVRAETILKYHACNIHKCIVDEMYNDNSAWMQCQVHGQQLALKDLEQKAKQGYFIRKWSCTLGTRKLGV